MNEELLQLTAEIVTSHVSNNTISAADLPALIQATYTALEKSSAPAEAQAVAAEPAVSIRASVKPDYIICLEDGKKLKMLKRYLRTNYNMTPEDYRAKWNLPRDYPMVAPNYAETRRTLAKSIGLGRKAKGPVSGVATSATNGVEATAQTIKDAVVRAADTVATPVAAAAKAGRKKLGIAAAKAAAVAHLGGRDEPSEPAKKVRTARVPEPA